MKECQGPGCSEIEEKIIDLINDQLDPDERLMIMAHLEACPDCGEEYQFLAECLNAYEAEDCLEMTAAYWEEFTVSVHDRIKHEKIRPRFPYAVVLPIAATLLAVVSIGYFVFIRPRHSQTAQPQPEIKPDNEYEEVYDLSPEQQEEFIQLINQRYGGQ